MLRVNGVEVLNLAHLRRLLSSEAPEGEVPGGSPPLPGGDKNFVRFELEDDRLMVSGL